MQTKRFRFCLGLVSLCLFVAGCATLAGKWESESLYPEMARDQFQLFKSDGGSGEFIRAKVTLNQDNTYLAEVYYTSSNDLCRGTWEYGDGRLTMSDEKYGTHSYTAKLSGDGKFLKLTQPIKGSDVVLTLARN